MTLSKQNSNTTKYLESIRREMALDTPLPYMKTYLVLRLLQFREQLCHKNSLEDRNSDLRMNYYAFAIPSVPRGCQILTYSWSDLHVYKATVRNNISSSYACCTFCTTTCFGFIDPDLEEKYPQFLRLNFTILPSQLRTTEEGREASSQNIAGH